MAVFNDASLSEFYAEADEIIQRVSAALQSLERRLTSPELLDSLYRDMHTMKGSAQLFGLNGIATVAHAMETCLDPLRKTGYLPSPSMLDSLFKCLQAIEHLMEALKAGNNGSSSESEQILSALFDATASQFGSNYSLTKDVYMAEEKISQLHVKAENAENPAQIGTPEESPALNAEATSVQQVQGTPVEPVDTTIRVQVGLLDMLMNLVGEMVLVRNQVLQHSSRSENLEFLNLSQRLDVVTSELQDQVMKTRMQPIGNVLGKFQRLIRDLARDLGKKIDLTLQGKETELDKTLLEAIKDPLTHIVRNACDHGIESPERRAAAGKPQTGHVSIRAYHEGGQVIIEISDDGAGLNRKRILAKAIERGILAPEAAERLSDREKANLIFHPGLSTAEQVSSVSGRGVGMDVVKTNIERIGGSVELDSLEGRGSTVRLRIPLTLAIVPAMLVRSGSDEYAIPQIKLVELVRVEQDKFGQRIKMVQGKPVFELRGKLLPLIELGEVLGKKRDTARSLLTSGETVNIVVLNAEGDFFGLVVDEVLDTADIVVKPLSKFLKSLEVFSAATILGSGRVALILDPSGLSKVAQLVLEKKAAESDFHFVPAATRSDADAVEYLLFRLGKENLALPLVMVSRLEDFKTSDVEYSGEQAVIQYRGQILPLISVASAIKLESSQGGGAEAVATIVIQRGERAFGLIVDEILDVCTENSSIDDVVRDRPGVLGNLIHDNEVIVIIDAYGIIDRELSRFGASIKAEPKPLAGKLGAKLRVLYAEDVGFFRRMVSKVLTVHGFDVVTAEDGQAALDLLKETGSPPFDLILSDIEMPKMNGFQLAKAIRESDGRFSSVPLVALTTRFSQKDIAEGQASGFDSYLEKLKPDLLLSTIDKLLKEKGSRAA